MLQCIITLLEGLQDASSSFDALRALSRMASLGMNIIMVIHQPRYTLYELFDSLLLLGVGGITVYNGPPLLTERWFSSNGFFMPSYDNMADFNLDVISGKVWCTSPVTWWWCCSGAAVCGPSDPLARSAESCFHRGWRDF